MYSALQKKHVDSIDNHVRYFIENIKFLLECYIKNLSIDYSLHPFLQKTVHFW